ncbi:MAG TPA: 5-oxoprolinase subunit PxpA [Vicinamibacterales bacterium]|nr:5-oxoprolinase subunit PxpA [Vicinamibacterales bacterium]
MGIDLNADVGESFGAYSLGHDADLVPLITSANVACGFHAGDPGVMRATVALARHHGVAVGAHPGFPDLVGFGRREMRATPREVEDAVAYQIGALAGIAATEGLRLQHVKAHGALYNMAVREAPLADAIAKATASVDRSLILLGLPGSQLVLAGRRAGLRTASEAFADRAYQPNGELVPRSQSGAVIEEADTVVSRAIMMAREHVVIAVDGTRVPIDVDTICVHGDTPGAAALARRIREALTQAGVDIAALGAAMRMP